MRRFPWRTYLPGRLLGRRGALLLGLGFGGAVLVAMVEYAIALLLGVFLASLGMVDSARLPAWWPFPPDAFSSLAIWVGLLLIGLVQAGARVLMYQSRMLFTELLGARFKMLLGYIVLKKDQLRAMPLSRIDFFMGECFPKATSFVLSALQTGTFAVEAALMLAGMLYLAPGEAVVGLAGVALMGWVVLQLNRWTHRMAGRIPEAGASLERTKLRISRNWVLIKILRIQDAEWARMNEAIFRYYRHSVLAHFFGQFGSAAMPVVGIVVIAMMVLAHFHWFDTTPGNFLAFLYLFVRLQQKLATGSNLIGGLFTTRLQYLETLKLAALPSKEDWNEAMAAERHYALRHASLPEETLRAAPPPLRSAAESPPAISLQGVSFQWPDAASAVFRDLDLDVPAGAQCGIVGANGSGKSTLLGVVLGIYPPTTGTVRIGGEEAQAYFSGHPGEIAYVGPEPYLIQGSLRENLAYGLPETPSDDALFGALRAVRLEELVRSLPAGLDYPIQEDGAGLSSGQKQRLTIARAFLRKPLLLILDEPSANLDDETESAVVETLALLKGRCTVLIVSHKPGILRGVDQLLQLSSPERSA